MSFLRPSRLKAVILLIFSVIWIFPAFASALITLKNIEVDSRHEVEQILLEFDGKYNGEPIINFDHGSMSLRFNSVHADPALPLQTETKSDSFIKAVRAVQVPETNVVHLDIILKSPSFKLDHPDISRNGNYVSLGLRRLITSTPSLSNTEVLTKEVESRVNTDQTLSSTISGNSADESFLNDMNDFMPIATEDWATTMLTLVLSLLFVLLLIYLIAYLYNRFFSGRFPSMQGSVRIKQVSSFHVGPKQKVVILDMNNRKFACGVTPSSINLIAELQDETDQSFLHVLQTDEKNDQINIDQARADFLRARAVDAQDADAPEFNQVDKEENFDEVIENENEGKEIFLKPNSQQGNDFDQSTDENKNFSTPIRPRFTKMQDKPEKLAYGNQSVQDFANKLSERLKFLKPIK
ncbi:MAG: hypothetical protein MAG581_02167 [Deltaproteobacteria bacterium]|jgi:flagellar biosynthetic protein FliO|nr:hypothetical protein [Deltaproteobacteria bacterium]